MSVLLLALNFTVSLWLGAYLVARDPASDRLRWTGLGLMVYAASLTCLISDTVPTGRFPNLVEAFCALLPAAPAVLWTGGLISLLPETHPMRAGLKTAWAVGQVPLVFIVLLLRFSFPVGVPVFSGSLLDYVFALLVLFPLLAAAFLIFRLATLYRPPRMIGLLLFGLLLFSVSTAFVIIPLTLFPRPLILLALGLDLLILGIAISVLDAFDLGEAFLPDFLRSGVLAGFSAVVFGLPVGLVIWFWSGPSETMLRLLFAVIALAVLWQTFRDRIEGRLDRLFFARESELSSERSTLLGTARSIPKIDTRVAPLELPSEQFIRLTRQAISQFGNLPRLAASPLTRLPAIERRLAARSMPPTSLARASELKALLKEAIDQLKPSDAALFGDAEAWRHYNALYFPYVAGIRPYARRQTSEDLSPAEKQALKWFRSQVPERTLYNWQNAAAALVAQFLKETS